MGLLEQPQILGRVKKYNGNQFFDGIIIFVKKIAGQKITKLGVTFVKNRIIVYNLRSTKKIFAARNVHSSDDIISNIHTLSLKIFL